MILVAKTDFDVETYDPNSMFLDPDNIEGVYGIRKGWIFMSYGRGYVFLWQEAKTIVAKHVFISEEFDKRFVKEWIENFICINEAG